MKNWYNFYIILDIIYIFYNVFENTDILWLMCNIFIIFLTFCLFKNTSMDFNYFTKIISDIFNTKFSIYMLFTILILRF